ncbi:DNA-binding IclR family transcriptional regulator [Leucobacter exalbidus]|uniref:DNA-binding IclR family transcriptional regulator n=1 Tax=Leucobacter exalbidus TaxID=662960 RepID=A0A940PN87_9MICO|nr:IclR family transcriptional regulator [Leucobacter exalbidus]MBP1326273.1 DNA-binding IclR family transcriptional regulator [Leucobacter exalbidus]
MSQSIQRAAEILELIAVRPRTQSEIAIALGVHRSTALRTMQTLTDSGLSRRRADGSYGLGYRLAGLATVAAEQFDMRNVAHHSLDELGRECTFTIHLAALEGDTIVYADKIEQPGMIKLYSQVGQPVLLHTAGVSKAILAFQDEATIDRVLRGHQFTKFTENTITSEAEFHAALVTTRASGWAADDAEYEDYVNCVAMPIRDASGRVIAAVSITALKAKADLETLTGWLPRLTETTEAISRDLGWRP